MGISRFKQKPATKTGWWAMGLGLSTLLVGPMLGIYAAVIRPMIDRAPGEYVGAVIGFFVGLFALALSVAALVIGIRALRKGERSWAVWVGFVPSVLAGVFWVLMIVGEFVIPH